MMSLYRRLPRSYTSCFTALETAYRMLTNVPPENNPLTPQTAARLSEIVPQFKAGLEAVHSAAVQAGQAVSEEQKAQEACSMYLRHALLSLFMGVERQVFPSHVLPLYGIHISRPVLPPLRREQELITVGKNFLRGEQKRVEDGGQPLCLPSAAEVKEKLEAFQQANIQEGTASQALRDRQGELKELRAKGEAIVRKVWDEVDTFYNELPLESRRGYARLWGVIYVGRKRIAATGVLVVAAPGDIPPDYSRASVELLQTGEKATVKKNGIFTLHTGYAGTGELLICMPGHADMTVPVTLGKENAVLGQFIIPAPPLA